VIYHVPRVVLSETFKMFRLCGAGERECVTFWLSKWSTPYAINEVVHPNHSGHQYGFELDPNWLNDFWNRLADRREGVRCQIHTHPKTAFHSPTDDAWPIVHTSGFLSLVIPDFGMKCVGFERAFLAELNPHGQFCELPIHQRLVIV
jgi:hypothetical protein